jgi:hypothetical protein
MTFGHKYRILRKKLDFYVGVLQGILIYFKCLWPDVLEHCHRTQHNDNSAQQCSFIMLIVVEFLFPRERRNISSREKYFFSLYLIILFRLPPDRKSWLLLDELEFQPSIGTSLSTHNCPNTTAQFVAHLWQSTKVVTLNLLRTEANGLINTP